jgi:oligoendopeptidase F
MTSHNWNFRRGNEHSPLVKIILQLQAVEPDLKKYGTEIIPSSKEEKRRLSLQIRKAITYYKEMLILFSVYLKQDLSSKGRHEDMAHANKTYGSALRSLSRLSASLFGVDELDRNNAPATNLGRSSSGTSALTKSKAELANKRKDEKILQQQYFQLISRTIPDNYQTPSKSDAFKELPRSLRHERWLAQNHSWAVIRPELAAVFDEIVLIRKDIAELSGFDNYAELLRQKRPPGWPSYFVQAVSGPCRSLLRANHLQWKTKLGLSILRPYDMNISEMQGFNGLDEWIDKTKTLLQRIHPYFLKVFNAIISDGLYDILPHKGKSPEAICFQLPYTGRAFIFMSLSGTRKDIMTSIHELGHAIHIASAQETNKLGYDYQVNATTSEFFALAMELLALDNLGSFYYDTDSLAWAKKMHI